MGSTVEWAKWDEWLAIVALNDGRYELTVRRDEGTSVFRWWAERQCYDDNDIVAHGESKTLLRAQSLAERAARRHDRERKRQREEWLREAEATANGDENV